MHGMQERTPANITTRPHTEAEIGIGAARTRTAGPCPCKHTCCDQGMHGAVHADGKWRAGRDERKMLEADSVMQRHKTHKEESRCGQSNARKQCRKLPEGHPPVPVPVDLSKGLGEHTRHQMWCYSLRRADEVRQGQEAAARAVECLEGQPHITSRVAEAQM